MSARILALIAAAVLAATTAATASADGYRPVTVISDSVMTSVTWHQENEDILSQGGYQIDYQTAIGRALAGQSKEFDGSRAPTLMALAPTIAIAPTVIVEMGYNDDAASFGANVDSTLDLLVGRGAQRIVWPTLAETASPDYPAQNHVLYQAMLRHPQLQLADWARYSQGHGDWFQTDYLHLMPAGGAGLATLLHGALAQPVCDPGAQALPVGTVGRAYSATLNGCGGTGALQALELLSGALPPGLTIADDGLSGTPTQAGTFAADIAFESGFLIGHAAVTITIDPPAKRTSPRRPSSRGREQTHLPRRSSLPR